MAGKQDRRENGILPTWLWLRDPARIRYNKPFGSWLNVSQAKEFFSGATMFRRRFGRDDA